MKLIKEDQNYVFGECGECHKQYKIKRENLELSYDGYKLKHGTVCSCSVVLKRIKGDVETKHCPVCAEKLADVLEICPHCHHDFKKDSDDEYRKKKIIFLSVLVVFFGSLIAVAGYFTKTTSELGQTNHVVVEKQTAEDMEDEEKGEMYLVDNEGIYLGELTSDTTDSNSILNPVSDYGIETSDVSLWNTSGKYGDKTSDNSAYNSSASNPPQIYYKGSFIAYVSKNGDLGKLTIDPDSLKQWVEDQGY